MDNLNTDITELGNYQNLLLKIKCRDVILFRIGLAAFAIILITTSISIYRWIESIDEQLNIYRSSLAQATKDVNQLKEKIGEQEKELASYQSIVHILNDTSVKSLIDSSSEHRKEIDVLTKKVNCIISNKDISLCR